MNSYPIDVSLEEAQELALFSVLSNRKQIEKEMISLDDSLERISAEDVCADDIILKKGSVIEVSDMAMLAAHGVEHVNVFRKLCAGILCIGSANPYLLLGILKKNQMNVEKFDPIPHDVQIIADQLFKALALTDGLVIIGGDSVDDHDVIKDAVRAAGGALLFWDIRMKPGSAAAAVISGKPVFVLSGDLADSAAVFQMLVMPVLRYMAGENRIYPRRLQARILNEYTKSSPDRQMLWGQLIVKNGEVFFETGEKQVNSINYSTDEWAVLGEIQADRVFVPSDELIFVYDFEHFTDQRGMNR